MSRSSNAARYGSLAEQKLADDRGLVLDGKHTSWCDAERQNGTPVEIKSGMVSTGYWQIYQNYHEKLRDANGWYGFVVYKPWGRGIRVIKTKMVRPDRLPLGTLWSPTGGHRDSEKAKLPFDEVFR